MNGMFLQFYGVSTERINDCVSELQKLHPNLEELSRELLPGDLPCPQPATEVRIGFKNITDLDALYDCQKSQALYRLYATDLPDVEFVVHRPGHTTTRTSNSKASH